MNLLCVRLQAIYPANNVKRFYCLRAGQDLLGDWIVGASYGRIGQAGNAKKWVCTSQEQAQKKVHALLHKRFHAQKRIGTNYTLTHMAIDPSLHPSAWITLPSDPSTPSS